MDTIYINELIVETIIGVFPFEQQIKQKLLLNIELSIDITRAAQSGNLKDTINYEAIATGLTYFIESQSFKLIETVAEKSVSFLFVEHPLIQAIKFSVTKPGAIRNAKGVGVTIQRRASA